MHRVFEIGDKCISDQEVLEIVGYSFDGKEIIYDLDNGQTAEESYLLDNHALAIAYEWVRDLNNILENMIRKKAESKFEEESK